jgi:hypothetical protein
MPVTRSRIRGPVSGPFRMAQQPHRRCPRQPTWLHDERTAFQPGMAEPPTIASLRSPCMFLYPRGIVEWNSAFKLKDTTCAEQSPAEFAGDNMGGLQ